MATSIAITGCGIICAIGNDCNEVYKNLREGQSGIGQMQYLTSVHNSLPVGEVKKSNDEMARLLGIEPSERLSRTSLMGAISVRQALADAGLTTEQLAGKRVALISGTTVGGMDVTERFYERMKSGDAPLQGVSLDNDCGHSTEEIAEFAGLTSTDANGDLTCKLQTTTISTACSSALNAIILGAEMLKNDEADIVIAGGSEALTRFHLNGFNTLMILDSERCRPFDDTRAGLNLGEGAAFVVLVKHDDKTPSNQAKAYVAGYGNRCDAFHQTASSDNGEGAYLAMKDALDMSGLRASDIQYVNAHGTGTPNNDLSESQALKRVFGDILPEISSTKSFTGHTTSASGSIETVICLLAMQHGFTPANLGWKNQIDGGITPTLGTDLAKQGCSLRHVLCNSFGFGGNDSSLIVSRDLPCTNETTLAAGSDLETITVAHKVVTDKEELTGLKAFVSPMESRRMGTLMKAALFASLSTLKEAGIESPDAIITATSHGMQELSQQFLDDIIANNETLLKPTLFMQSTHNTLSSAIAIRTKCHGYNVTYSHGKDSLDWAMREAKRLLKSGRVKTVLVGCFDESTPLSTSYAERCNQEPEPPLYAAAYLLTVK